MDLKCTYDKQSCPEKPLLSRPNTLAAADGFPICCDVIMDDILAATVDAMNQIGMDYRIVYGTLLGAVRSQAFIPYSDDVDVAILKANNDKYDNIFADAADLRSQVLCGVENKSPSLQSLSALCSSD